LHVCPFAQATPHAPQLAGSLPVLVHELPQRAVPVGQRQRPPVHCMAAAHTVPQAPQLLGSVCVSAHPFMHETVPMGHTHLPFAHAVQTPF
jgi:hypothetical protein